VATVWVYAQVGPEGVHASAPELLTKARSLGDRVEAVALGPGATAAADVLGAHGADRVFASDDEVFADHPGRPAAHVLAALVEEHHPAVVLFATTYDARDVAGRLQAHTGSTLMSNATDVPAIDRATTEIFGGTNIVEVALEGPEPKIVLVRPRSIEAEPSGGTAEVVPIAVEVPDELRGVRVLERHAEATTGAKLEDARVVIAGGRGLGGPEPFALLEALADAIGGAAVGASRAAVDAGWVPYTYQIGQTGRTVKPEVYIAIGVSGALQHVVGMKAAKHIVAINKDAESPMMRMADLGVAGDLFQVVPALTEEIRRRKGS
jgi:electron transfer flavoprotein alpha subunit